MIRKAAPVMDLPNSIPIILCMAAIKAACKITKVSNKFADDEIEVRSILVKVCVTSTQQLYQNKPQDILKSGLPFLGFDLYNASTSVTIPSMF
jgi:hypothetical protein